MNTTLVGGGGVSSDKKNLISTRVHSVGCCRWMSTQKNVRDEAKRHKRKASPEDRNIIYRGTQRNQPLELSPKSSAAETTGSWQLVTGGVNVALQT